jgi:hypothetical protein
VNSFHLRGTITGFEFSSTDKLTSDYESEVNTRGNVISITPSLKEQVPHGKVRR